MKKITILLAILIVGCKVDICTIPAYKQKVGSNTSKTISKSNATSKGVSIDNPLILGWFFNYDSISNIVHSVGKFNEYYQEWEAQNWVGFNKDIYIHKDKRLLLSTVNCIVDGNIYGEGTIEIRDCKSQLVVNGEISNTIIKDVGEGCSIIINKPLNGNDIYSNREETEVPCEWELPKLINEKGTNWYYTKK